MDDDHMAVDSKTTSRGFSPLDLISPLAHTATEACVAVLLQPFVQPWWKLFEYSPLVETSTKDKPPA